MEVTLIHWPAEDERRRALVDAHLPRLLLVDGEAPSPPPDGDCLEDWVRATAPEDELAARIHALRARARAHLHPVPAVDEHGVLRYGGRAEPLPPVEARLVRALTGRFGTVVGYDTMLAAGWGTTSPRRNVLDVHMLKVRRRLAPLGLNVRTVRSRGYLLDTAIVVGPTTTAKPHAVGQV